MCSLNAAKTSTLEVFMNLRLQRHAALAAASACVFFLAAQLRAADTSSESPMAVTVVMGLEDRQVGGIPMMMGKAAIPYSGGRFVSLFSHKKYDSLTVEYVDANGGLHGAIFRIAKGEGLNYRRELAAKGAHISPEEE